MSGISNTYTCGLLVEDGDGWLELVKSPVFSRCGDLRATERDPSFFSQMRHLDPVKGYYDARVTLVYKILAQCHEQKSN